MKNIKKINFKKSISFGVQLAFFISIFYLIFSTLLKDKLNSLNYTPYNLELRMGASIYEILLSKENVKSELYSSRKGIMSDSFIENIKNIFASNIKELGFIEFMVLKKLYTDGVSYHIYKPYIDKSIIKKISDIVLNDYNKLSRECENLKDLSLNIEKVSEFTNFAEIKLNKIVFINNSNIEDLAKNKIILNSCADQILLLIENYIYYYTSENINLLLSLLESRLEFINMNKEELFQNQNLEEEFNFINLQKTNLYMLIKKLDEKKFNEVFKVKKNYTNYFEKAQRSRLINYKFIVLLISIVLSIIMLITLKLFRELFKNKKYFD